ncbi:MAG: hypothetical protein KF852_01065 [Saprospiraceae bacterium]|nr:hypothetical protein [Saprospiraceae bacterium]
MNELTIKKIKESIAKMDANSNRVGGLITLLGSLIGLSPLFFEEQFFEQITMQRIGKEQIQFTGLLISLIGMVVFNRTIAIIVMVVVLLSYIVVFLL